MRHAKYWQSGAEERTAELLAEFKRTKHIELGPSVDDYVEATADSFFVPDEPVANVVAAFETAEKHLTAEPTGTGWCAPSP